MLLWNIWEKSVAKAKTDPIKITFIANAGLLIEYHNTTFLLDSIYGPEGHPFSALPKRCWENLLQGNPPFDQVDHLLFTHLHPDHFSPKMTLEYLKSRPVKDIFLPADDAPELYDLLEYIKAKRIPYTMLDAQVGPAKYHIGPDITVQAFCTAHLDRKYQNVPHVCYLLSFRDTHILFTADVDYVHETLSFVADIPLRAVFLNPLFFHALQKKQFFQGKLDTQVFCVYHVPFLGDDTMGICSMLERDIEVCEQTTCRAIPLYEAYQQILL